MGVLDIPFLSHTSECPDKIFRALWKTSFGSSKVQSFYPGGSKSGAKKSNIADASECCFVVCSGLFGSYGRIVFRK